METTCGPQEQAAEDYTYNAKTEPYPARHRVVKYGDQRREQQREQRWIDVVGHCLRPVLAQPLIRAVTARYAARSIPVRRKVVIFYQPGTNGRDDMHEADDEQEAYYYQTADQYPAPWAAETCILCNPESDDRPHWLNDS